jgi:hypothetical protein
MDVPLPARPIFSPQDFLQDFSCATFGQGVNKFTPNFCKIGIG